MVNILKFSPLGLLVVIVCLTACNQQSKNLALGTLERDRVVLKATAAEIITQLPVAEGKNVAAGDVVVQLDTHRQLAAVSKAQASLAIAQANLLKLQNGARLEDIEASRAQVANVKAQFIDTQKSFERTASLVNQKLMGVAQLDTARAKRDSAQANLEQAEATFLSLTHGNRAEDIQQAEAQVAVAQAALVSENIALEDLTLRATRAGRLDELPKHLGERSGIGESLAVILDNAAPYARIYIPETARASIKVGQHFDLHVDGVAATLNGTLRWIAQEPAFTPYYALNSSDRSRLVYLAKVQLPESAGDLPSGIPVQVELPGE